MTEIKTVIKIFFLQKIEVVRSLIVNRVYSHKMFNTYCFKYAWRREKCDVEKVQPFN